HFPPIWTRAMWGLGAFTLNRSTGSPRIWVTWPSGWRRSSDPSAYLSWTFPSSWTTAPSPTSRSEERRVGKEWGSGGATCHFQAEDGIRDFHVTGVQTCALPISLPSYLDPGHVGPWGIYLEQVDRVTPYLGHLAKWVETLKRPKRVLVVDVPVELDDGTIAHF